MFKMNFFYLNTSSENEFILKSFSWFCVFDVCIFMGLESWNMG